MWQNGDAAFVAASMPNSGAKWSTASANRLARLYRSDESTCASVALAMGAQG